MTIRLFHSSKTNDQNYFLPHICICISDYFKNCNDHFFEIDWINKMTLLVRKLSEIVINYKQIFK